MNLIDAARNGDIKTINRLLDEGADLNKLSEDGRLPLAVAVRNSNTTSSLETVKLLLDRGADPDLKEIGNNGFTALIIAARYSNKDSSLETVKLLLERKAKVDLRNDAGNTALIVAAGNSTKDSSVETVKLLLDNGANVNLINNQVYSALRAAANYSHMSSSLETVKLLLEYGADPFVEIKCPTVECEKLIASYRWKLLHQRDMDTAKRYSKNAEIQLPKEVWEIILLNKYLLFTLGHGANLHFSKGDAHMDLYTEPNSLYIMSGEARYSWKHEMKKLKYDVVNGKKVKRGERISVTFRSVL